MVKLTDSSCVKKPNILTVIADVSGDFRLAIEEHTEELEISTDLNDKEGQAFAHRMLGECFMSTCDLDSAREVSLSTFILSWNKTIPYFNATRT